MGNVYEVSAKKVITSTNTDFIELEDGLDVENEEVSKELGELILDQMSCFRNQEGDKKTDVSVDVLPSNQKEGSYYCFTRKNYNPEVIVNNCGIVGERMGWTFHPEDGVFMRNLEDDIDVPPETISILYYSIKRHSRMSHTYLPHTKLCFYFNIEKEKVVKLWNNGKINELMTHNIIPTNPNQFNRQDYIWTRGLRVGGRKIVHPNHPCLLKEIYKKRKQKKVKFLVVFGKEEINLSLQDFSCLGCVDGIVNDPNYKIPEYDTTTLEKIIIEDD